MKKIIILCTLLLSLLFFLTGCYDAISLEKFYYAIAISIDSSDKSNILLSVQVAMSNSSSNSSSQSTQNKIYSVDCENIDIGINIINNYLSKKINLSHCSAIIFSEEIAKRGIKDYINELANNPEIRPNSHIIICESKGTDILENVSKSGENYSSRYYEFVINTVESTGYAAQSEFEKFFYDINALDAIPTANYVTVKDNAVQNIGIAVFKDDIFNYYLSPYESLAHLLVSNRLKECIIEIPNPYDSNSKISVNIKKRKNTVTNIKLVNNKPFINTNVYINGKIMNMPNINDNLNKIESELNNQVKIIIENYYYTIIKNHNSDIENFSRLLSNRFLTLKSFNKVNWDGIFPDSSYTVNVDSRITSGLFTKK